MNFDDTLRDLRKQLTRLKSDIERQIAKIDLCLAAENLSLETMGALARDSERTLAVMDRPKMEQIYH